MNDKKIVEVKVFRFDPEVDREPYYDTFQVETRMGVSIYNALQYIQQNLDPSLAFYASCRIGQCHGCIVKANGKVVHSCKAMLEEDVVLEPADSKRVLKDLVMTCSTLKQ